MTDNTPFPFLDLPKELRLMVYENLTIRTKTFHVVPLENNRLDIQLQTTTHSAFDTPPHVTITLHTLPLQILCTSRLITAEARPLLAPKLLALLTTSTPRLCIPAACLYNTVASTCTQTLLRALLHTLNAHLAVAANPHLPSSPSSSVILTPRPPGAATAPPLPFFPPEITQWLVQTTTLLLAQRPPPCPLQGFMGTSPEPAPTPRVRLLIDVPQTWASARRTCLPPRASPSLQAQSESPVQVQAQVQSTPPLYTCSVASQLSELYGVLIDYSRGLRCVRGGAIVFAQGEAEGGSRVESDMVRTRTRNRERERERDRDRNLCDGGLVVWKRAALEFGVYCP